MKSRLKGRVQVAIREGDRVVHRFPWQNNLILDQGLDYVASTLYNQLFNACAAGTGTQATKADPGTTATVSGTALTAAIACFSNADLAANVVFDTGQIAKIIGYVSPTQVTLNKSLTISTATHFVIEFVNQGALGAEVKRTVTYLTTPGACTSTVTPATITLQRTFLFTPESAAITYTELGFSPQSAGGANLFSRVLLANAVSLSGPSDQLPNGQQLQVTYQLEINFDYGQGSGTYFPGNTPVTIGLANLPISYSIWAYASSPSQLNQLAVTVTGTMPVNPGNTLVLAGCSYAPYNGTWEVLDYITFTDGTHGPSTTISLKVTWVTGQTPSGGTLNVDMNGWFFRSCQGIFLVNAYGQSAAPSPTPDAFVGYDEPSVAGQIWISTAGGALMGSNGVPFRIAAASSEIVLAPCLQSSYVSGSFNLTQSGTIAVDSNGLYMSSFGYGQPDATNQVNTYYFDQPHALSPLGTLQLNFLMSWARD